MNSGVVPKLVTLWIGRPDYLIQKYTIIGEWTEENQREFDAVSLGRLPDRKVEEKQPDLTLVKSPGRPPEMGQLKLF